MAVYSYIVTIIRKRLGVYGNNASTIFDFADDSTDVLHKFKERIAGQIGNNGTKTVEIMLPLKYLTNFWRTHEIPLINCEINLNLP